MRGEVGAPRIASAKLERCDECGLGLELILRVGGGDRPSEDAELLSDCDGEVAIGAGAPFRVFGVSAWSVIVVGRHEAGGAGCSVKQGRESMV